ncbi:uncharacterized protein [Mytilus edulis]|uniref:uncharacterized protein n=1 Tax=Mytilus edulis TaxID=6550 RepID=UPI0039EF84F9
MNRLICLLLLVVAVTAHRYKGGSKIVRLYGDDYVVSYVDYCNKFHGFKISNNRFSYAGQAYLLKCGAQRFYNLWSNCWNRYHSKSVCFGRLRKINLFAVYSGGYDSDDSDDSDDYTVGSGSVISYLDYCNRYHGFKIKNSRFSYGGKVYRLKCEAQRFYNLWSNCWSSYKSRSVCFSRFRKRNLFVLYTRGWDADFYSTGSSVISYLDYCNKFHGFKIRNSRFSYAGKSYRLKCKAQRFYNLWSNCWNRYHSQRICFGRLRKINLFAVYSGGSVSVISYLDYCGKYRGFRIRNSRFSYGGKVYTVTCGLQRFYNLWGNCWNSYKSRSVCFSRLRKRNYFVVYPGEYGY